jgi:Arc/MetJ family transcription regulator
MAKHLVDIDEEALSAARLRLGARTIKETVNRALKEVGGEQRETARRALDRLARADLTDRERAWR